MENIGVYIINMFLVPIEWVLNLLPETQHDSFIISEQVITGANWISHILDVTAVGVVLTTLLSFETGLLVYRVIKYIYKLLPLT